MKEEAFDCVRVCVWRGGRAWKSFVFFLVAHSPLSFHPLHSPPRPSHSSLSCFCFGALDPIVPLVIPYHPPRLNLLYIFCWLVSCALLSMECHSYLRLDLLYSLRIYIFRIRCLQLTHGLPYASSCVPALLISYIRRDQRWLDISRYF